MLLIPVLQEAFSSMGKRSMALPAVIFLASHTYLESTSARNWDQCSLLADWIALKYMYRARQAWAEEV